MGQVPGSPAPAMAHNQTWHLLGKVACWKLCFGWFFRQLLPPQDSMSPSFLILWQYQWLKSLSWWTPKLSVSFADTFSCYRVSRHLAVPPETPVVGGYEQPTQPRAHRVMHMIESKASQGWTGNRNYWSWVVINMALLFHFQIQHLLEFLRVTLWGHSCWNKCVVPCSMFIGRKESHKKESGNC